MKAMVLNGMREVKVIEQPLPAIRHPVDLLLRIIRVGLCGSDIHYYTEGRIGDQIVPFPYSIGHECSAVVTDIG